MKTYLQLLVIVLLCSTLNGNGQSSLHFDGNDNLVMPQIDELVGTGAKSVDAWIKISNISKPKPVIVQFGQDITAKKFCLRVESDGGEYPRYLRVEMAGGFKYATTTDLNDNKWHHVAVTVAAEAGIHDAKLYVDGVMETSHELSGTNVKFNTDTGRVWVGRANYQLMKTPDPERYFVGNIDELRLWNIELTASQISSIYDSVVSHSDNPNLMAYMRFNEGEGITTSDTVLDRTATFGYFYPSPAESLPTWSTDSPTLRDPSASPAEITSYYIDPELGDDSWSGSIPKPDVSGTNGPWKTINPVQSMQTGDDIYFKCGTTLAPDSYLNINWEGTESDPVIIGAYYIENDKAVHGVKGNRPILSGGDFMVPENSSTGGADSWKGMIQVYSRDYIHIENLHIKKSGFYGIHISGNTNVSPTTNSAYFKIENVWIDGAYSNGIVIGQNPNAHGLITGCEVNGASECWKSFGKRITGALTIASSPYSYTTIEKNYVHHNYGEGIGSNRVFKAPRADHSGHATIKDNIVWCNRRTDIYLDATEHNKVFQNLVLGAGEAYVGDFHNGEYNGRKWNSLGIYVNSEASRGEELANTLNHNLIYNNLVAGHTTGIYFSSDHTTGILTMEGNKFYNNTLIGNYYNWNLGHKFSNYQMIDNEIRNNISYVPADVSFGQECKNDFSWIDDKITFSNNAWSEIPTHTGSPSDVVITDNFIKTTGWQDLSEVIEKANFKLTSGSTAINSGADLGTFFNIDCFDNPRPQGAGWDIGAHELDLNTGNLNVGSRNGGVQLSIYPNPSTNNLISVTYKLPASCDVEIFILDISGKTVQAFKYKKQAGTNVLNFATNNFPKGIYFCKLVTGGNMVVEKFIVQN